MNWGAFLFMFMLADLVIPLWFTSRWKSMGIASRNDKYFVIFMCLLGLVASIYVGLSK